jgi:alcohol dehydrogenase
MTLTLPPHITAATAMDALTHAMEAYTGLAKNPQSDAAALTAVALIARHLPRVMENPDDARGRLALANAATLAGMAFSNSMCGMVHNLGHAVGAVCGVPHGACMAVFLPYGLEYNVHKNGSVTGELLLPLAGEEVFARTPAYQRPFRVVETVRQLNRRLREQTGGRHACNLQELRTAGGEPWVPRERFPAIVASAMRDGASIFSAEDLDREDVLMVLNQAWEGLPLDRTRVRRG